MSSGQGSQVDALIAALKQEGRIDSVGAFTLDREKAREKMQRFQLADPLHYLLALVRALVAKGAREVYLDIDANDVRLEADGAPFDVEDFEHLYNAILGKGRGRRAEPLRELAIGLNSAMALRPRFILVESGDDSGGAELEMRPGVSDRFEATIPKADIRGTRIHVRERFRPGAVLEFFRNRFGELPEERLLRDRCRFATIAVTLEGEALAAGLDIDHDNEDTLLALGSLGPSHRGVVRLTKGSDPGLVRIVQHGVHLVDHEVPALPPGTVVVVDAPGLTRDVGQGDVLRDAAYEALLEHLRETVEEGLCHLASDSADAEAADNEASLALLRAVLRQQATKRLRKRTDRQRLVAALMSAPIWPTTAGELVSADSAVGHFVRSGVVPYHVQPYPGITIPEHPFVLLLRTADQELFGRLTKTTALVNCEPLLIAGVERERKRQAFLRRRATATLPDAPYLVGPCDIAWPSGKGQVALQYSPEAATRLRFVLDGCLLGERAVDIGLSGLEVVLDGPFEPSDGFDDVVPGPALADAVEAVLAEIEPLLARLADQAGDREVATEAQDVVVTALMACFDPELRARVQSALGLAPTASSGPALLSPAAFTAEPPHPASALRVFTDNDGVGVSLADLAEGADSIAVVPQSAPRVALRVGDPRVLRVSEAQRHVLQEALGANRISDWSATYQTRAREADHDSKSQVPLVAEESVGRSVTFEVGDVRGVAWVPWQPSEWSAAPAVGEPCQANATLLLRRRSLGARRIPSATAPVVCRIGGPFTPNASWDDAVDDPTVARASAAAYDASWQLALTDEGGQQERHLLAARALTSLFPAPWFVRAFIAIDGDLGLFARVLGRGQQAGIASVNRDLRALLRGHDDGYRQGASEVSETFQDAPAAFSERAHAAIDALLDAPLLRRCVGGSRTEPASVRAAVTAFGRERRLAWLPGVAVEPVVAERFVLCAPAEDLALLKAIFAHQSLEPAEGWLASRARARQFESRPTVAVELSEVLVLTTIEVSWTDERDGAVRGLVGLTRQAALSQTSLRGTSQLRLLTRERDVATVEGISDVGLVAVLDVSQLSVDDTFTAASDPSQVERLVKRLVSFEPQLVQALLVQALIDEADGGELGPAAWRHVLGWLGRTWPGKSGRLGPLLEDPTAAAVAGLAQLRTASGRRASLETLRLAATRSKGLPISRTVPTLTREPSADSPLAALLGTTVVELEQHERRSLERLFGELVDVTSELFDAVAADEARANAELAPTLPPENLAALQLDGGPHALQGILWLPAQLPADLSAETASDGLTVALCADGRVVTRRVLAPGCAVAGSIHGDDVAPNPRFSNALIPSDAERWLFARAVALYQQLAGRFEDLEGAERALAADYLRHAARTLAQARAGGTGGIRKELTRLYSKVLRKLPLVGHPRLATIQDVERAGVDVGKALAFVDRRREHLASPAEPLTVTHGTRWIGDVPIAGSDPGAEITGNATVLSEGVTDWFAADPSPSAAARASVRLLLSHRGLAEHQVSVPCGPFEAVVAAEALTPTIGWDGVEHDAPLEAVEQAVRAVTAAVVEAMARASGDSDPARRRWLLAAIAQGFDGVEDVLHRGPAGSLAARALFRQLDGPHVSLLDVARLAAEHGSVGMVDVDAWVAFETGRVLLTVDAAERDALQAALGAAGVEDATGWLDEQVRARRFEARAVEEVGLKANDAIVVVTVDEDGVTGEVGLAAMHSGAAGDEPESDLRLFKKRRRAGRHRGFAKLGLVAALNDDRLRLDASQIDVVADERFEAVAQMVVARLPSLMLALVDAWDRLEPEGRRVGWQHTLDYLARRLDGGSDGGSPGVERLGVERLNEDALLGQVAGLPGFLCADGVWRTLRDVAAVRARYGRVFFLSSPPPPGQRPVDPERHVIIAPAGDQRRLGRIAGPLEDDLERWRAEQLAHSRRSSRPALPKPGDHPALWRQNIATEALEGEIYLPATSAAPPAGMRPVDMGELTLGCDGLAVARVRVDTPFPVAGFVSGTEVDVAADWGDAALTERGIGAVRAQTVALYQSLAKAYAQGSLPADAVEPARQHLTNAACLFQLASDANAGGATRAARKLMNQTLLKLPLLWPVRGVRPSFADLAARGYGTVAAFDSDLLAREHFARAVELVGPEVSLAVSTPVSYGEVTGVIGIPARPIEALELTNDAAIKGTWVDLFLEQRRLGGRLVRHRVGPLAAALDHPGFMPVSGWRDVEEDAAFDELSTALNVGLGELVPLVVAALERQDLPGASVGYAQRLVANALRSAYPSGAFAQAHRLLRAQHDAVTADRTYVEIARLCRTKGLARMDAAVSRLVREEATLTAKAVAKRAEKVRPKGKDADVPELPGDAPGVAAEKVTALIATLRRAPIFTTWASATTGQGLASVDALDRELAAFGEVAYLDEPPFEGTTTSRLFLRPQGRPFRRALEAIYGKAAIRSGASWLTRERARRVFLERPAVSVALSSLSDDRVLWSAPLVVPGAAGAQVGEVGLEASHVGAHHEAGGRLRVHLHTESRLVQTLSRSCPYRLVASLNDPELPVDAGFGRVRPGPELDRLLTACELAVDGLVGELPARWTGLSAGERRDAYRHALDYLAHVAPQRWSRGELPAGVARELARLPGLGASDGGTLSLDAVRAAATAHGEVGYLVEGEAAIGAAPPGTTGPVLVLSARELETLRRVVPELTDMKQAWEDAEVARQRRAQAPQMAAAPVTTLALHSIEGADATVVGGQLWVPVHPDAVARVHVGADGLLVGRMVITPWLPLSGAIEGPGLAVDRRFEGFEPTELAGAALLAAAVKTYEQLAHRYQHQLFGNESHHAAAALVLREAALSLWRAQSNEQVALPRPLAVLYRDTLSQLPLLVVEDGRALSVAVALKERPMLLRLRAGGATPGATPSAKGDEGTPDQRLLRALRRHLLQLQERNRALLSSLNLGRIALEDTPRGDAAVSCDQDGTRLARRHPLVEAALASAARPGRRPDAVLVGMLASQVYTALNLWLEDVTDADEDAFHTLLLEQLASGLLAGRKV